MMSRRLAPSDFRIPISRVRSATATSMMFMITSPPTMRPIAGNAVPAIVITFLSLSMNASALADVSMKKLSGSLGLSLRRPRITSRTFSIASPMVSAVGVCTMMPSTSPRGLVKWWSGELYGAIATRSRDNPNTEPCFSSTPITVYGIPLMRSWRPSGSRSGKKYFATSSPMTTTGAPSADSCGVNSRPE